MSDAYRDLVENLRAAVVPSADGGEATRQRILRDLPRAKPGARRTRTLLLLAAAFLVSTAFALYIASLAARDAERASKRASPVEVPTSPAPQPMALGADASASTSAPSPALEVAPQPTPVSPRARTRPARTTRHALPTPVAASPALEPAPQPEAPSRASARVPVSPEQRRMLYIEAHRQHFRGSPQQALAAWDAFLATDPAGQVLLEARYNRAVTLLRLGRRSEAEQALAPFARGDHAGFRQVEAQQLLQRLAR